MERSSSKNSVASDNGSSDVLKKPGKRRSKIGEEKRRNSDPQKSGKRKRSSSSREDVMGHKRSASTLDLSASVDSPTVEDDAKLNESKENRPYFSSTDSDTQDNGFVVTTISSTGAKSKSPSGRWGHSLCLLTEEEALVIGGQGDKQQFCKDSVWHLDIDQGLWDSPLTSNVDGQTKPEMRMGHVAVYDPMIRAVYIYGGSKNKKWFSDVHLLDVEEWTWSLVKAEGAAPQRAYHSATLYRHELWVFGGVYPNPDPQPDGCSNDIHVFSPIQQGWYRPLVMGEKPSPRSGHSATLLVDKLVVFGGWDAPIPYNDVHVLDMCLVEWSEPTIGGQGPSARSWHASCALAGNRVLIHGGYNGNNALDDSFILNLDTLSWTEVKLQPSLTARAGHAAICLPYKHANERKDEVLIFGGGDNEGSFFNDLTCVMVPFEVPSVLR